jgi:hypothetical protein
MLVKEPVPQGAVDEVDHHIEIRVTSDFAPCLGVCEDLAHHRAALGDKIFAECRANGWIRLGFRHQPGEKRALVRHRGNRRVECRQQICLQGACRRVGGRARREQGRIERDGGLGWIPPVDRHPPDASGLGNGVDLDERIADCSNLLDELGQDGFLTGAFLWRFADGTEARTHINGATANRVTTQGAEIFGTMKINMFEATGAAPDSELLYLAYEGRISAEGTKVTVSVKGRFIGGTGRYKGATGEVELASINGFFNNGKGTLNLNG